MSYQIIRAGINLYAVLKNLEDLIAQDATCRDLIAGKKLSIQFLVKGGPKSWIQFENDRCTVGQGRMRNPSVVLWYTSPEHLNKMFDGKGNPIPLKGFTKLGFLQKEFSQITDKLEYYLKPDEVRDPSDEYIRTNTQFTLTVAAFSLSEIACYDEKAKLTASHMPDGITQLRVLPGGPSVYITVKEGRIMATKGIAENPDAVMEMKDYRTANDFLNGKSNPFKAIALGDVMIKGQTPMLDSLSLILGKVNDYVG